MTKGYWVLTAGFACLAAPVLGLLSAGFIQYQRDDHPIDLPRPRGPHAVGRVVEDWHDASRQRELMVFLWYPARNGATGVRAQYIPGKWGEIEAQGMIPIPARRLMEIRVSAIPNAPIDEARLPILVLLPGMGRIPPHYTAIAEDLASYGYLVVGVTPTGSARPVVFSDGRVDKGVEFDKPDPARDRLLVETWRGDASFALDRLHRDAQFADRADFSRIGIFGHSFGGDVAARTLETDPRFQRAVDMDGAVFGDSPLKLHADKPLLILEAGGHEEIFKSADDCHPPACRVEAFPAARHMNFSDASILPSRFPITKNMMLLGDIDGAKFLCTVSDRLGAFFDRMRPAP